MIIWNIDNQGVSAPRALSNVWVRGILESTGPCIATCCLHWTTWRPFANWYIVYFVQLWNVQLCNLRNCEIGILASLWMDGNPCENYAVLWLHLHWKWVFDSSLHIQSYFHLLYFCCLCTFTLLLCLLLFCFIYHSTTFFWLLCCSILIILLCHAFVLFWQN